MRRTGADMHPSALADLALPSLPGARCQQEWRLFDAAVGRSDRPDVIDARSQALRCCPSCPCLT